MRLFIAPKRDVALAISVALGGPSVPTGSSFKLDDDEVTWLAGHLLRLGNPQEHDERYETWSLDDLPMSWPIAYLPDERHQHHLAAVVELARNADELVNAGDPDSEGQRLVDEIIEYAGLESKPTMRLLINDNNPMAILKASLSMRNNQNYRGLSLSALARSVCDQRYGFNLTRAYTLLARQKGYIGVLSVGRVQTPILGLIVSREKKLKAHTPRTYFEVAVDIDIKQQTVRCLCMPNLAEKALDEPQQLELMGEDNNDFDSPSAIADQASADKILAAISGQPVSLISTQTETVTTPPPLPHSLLSLQAEAAGIYGYRPSYVHEIAQSLRDEFMAITYHRSDSRYLSNERFREAPAVLDVLSDYAPELLTGSSKNHRSRAFDSEKVTSHHAIIPTLNVPSVEQLSADQQNIYNLIARAYAVQFQSNEISRVTTLIFEIAGYQFQATAKKRQAIGWRSLYHSQSEQTHALPKSRTIVDLEAITRFDHGKVAHIETLKRTTPAPSLYTMQTLLQDLTRVADYVTDPVIKNLLLEKDSDKQDEAGGIGTPATRDKHIETLFTRGFITETDSTVVSTPIGRDFHDALPEFAVKPDLTALWHEKQKQIESGELDYQTFISDMDAIIAEEVARAKRVGLNIKVKPIKCPVCNTGHLVLRTSKAKQQFWGCSIFPECRATFSDLKGKPDIPQG